MNPFWVILLTLVSVTAGTGACFWLLHKAQEVQASVWAPEHVICPLLRILVLLVVVSLVYPSIGAQAGGASFWSLLDQQGQFNDLINILFFGGLLLSFLPVVSHPVLALPIQSILSIALVFSWQHAASMDQLQLLPSPVTGLKIVGYMFVAYLLTREVSTHLSRWLDRKYHIEGSIRLLSDAIYLVLQIPVMLIYCGFLKDQLPSEISP